MNFIEKVENVNERSFELKKKNIHKKMKKKELKKKNIHKKYIYISVFLSLLIILFIAFILFYNNRENRKFDKKIDLLSTFISENENVSILKENKDEYTVFMSVCDNETQAIVKRQKAASIKKAFDEVKNETEKYIKENNYSAELVKIDFVNEIQELTMNELKAILSKLEQEYTFRYGIVFDYDDREDIILTEAELNSNRIIDYDDCKISLKRLNQYLEILGESKLEKLPEKLKKFNTVSYFCDENDIVYEIDETTGQRKQEKITQEEVDKILNNSTNYLINMIEGNGKYIYGYNPLKDEENETYNILRHAGTTWSIIEQYDSTPKQKKAIESTVNYLISTVKYLNEETAYVEELKNGELKLGGNALAIIAISEYINKFENNKHLELLKKLGNGIINMQAENGSFIHVLNASDFSIIDKYRTVYYDGEAAFALCKLYAITKDKKYLDAAEKAIRYFIDNNYSKYCDHWISYAMNEITKYVDNEEYYEFGLQNIFENLDAIKNKTYSSHINFEMLIQGFELYCRAIEKNINTKYSEKSFMKELINVINYRADFQLCSYLYPEIAMYLTAPSKYMNTFYIRHSNYRIRIDDIQHSILGYHFYNKNFEKINQISKNAN